MNWPPWLILLLLVSLAAALVYQLLTRRYGWRVLGYWATVFAAILLFQAGAELAGLDVSRVGDVRLGPVLAGAGTSTLALWFLGV